MTMPFYVSTEQMMKDRADYARKGIARGRSLVAFSAAEGIVIVAENPSRTLYKISEIYDRIAFAGVGKYNEYDSLRIAGVRHADLKGFAYSREEGTPAHDMPDQVPEARKDRRRRELMLLTRRLSRQRNEAFVGQELDVLVEGTVRGRDGVEHAVGRSYRDAPEVDGVVILEGPTEPGPIVRARITGANDYDLRAATTGVSLPCRASAGRNGSTRPPGTMNRWPRPSATSASRM